MLPDVEIEPELQQASDQTGPPRSILIAGGNAAHVAALSGQLSKLGFSTLIAHEAGDVLAIAQQHRPSLVLLERSFPDADGLQVCSQLADAPATCCTPVIVLSDEVRDELVRRARAAGCAFVLSRPYDPNALLALIEIALEQATSSEW